MKALTLALAGTVALATAALAAGSGPGSANNAPVQEGAQNPSQYGATADTPSNPDRGATTGSTVRDRTGASESGAKSGSAPR